MESRHSTFPGAPNQSEQAEAGDHGGGRWLRDGLGGLERHAERRVAREVPRVAVIGKRGFERSVLALDESQLEFIPQLNPMAGVHDPEIEGLDGTGDVEDPMDRIEGGPQVAI